MLTTAVPAAHPTLPPHAMPVEMAQPRPRALSAWHVLGAVLVLSAAYVFWHLGRGWIPHDDGTLAQSAERVLQGQLPHRDYDEIYSGGLAYLDAAAFKLLGTTLWSLRLVLFAAFLGWIPTVFYIASRFVRPLAAGGVTLLAAAWSVPNYPVPMPSWYNLFLATAGVAALCRYLETRRSRWLVAAGVAGGLSFLVKVIGLYYVAGAMLFLVFEAHLLSRAANPDDRQGIGYQVFVSVALLTFVAALAALVRHRQHGPEYAHFVIPGALIAALLISNEWRQPAGPSGARFATLARLLVPFLLGVALPVAIFLVPYARTGALGAFFNGIFILPTRRFAAAASPVLPFATMLALLPLAGLAVAARRPRGAGRGRQQVLLGAVLVLLLFATGRNAFLYRSVWYSVRTLVPVLVLAGVIALGRVRAGDAGEPLLRSRTMVLLSVTALCSIVQFPFAAPIYFCYVAPLAWLLVVALLRYLRPVSYAVPVTVLGFYTAFAVLRVNTSTLYTMGEHFEPYPPTMMLAVERGGVTVNPAEAREHEAIVAFLAQRARGGYTWASPDCPQVYYLSGLKNPTRSLFEFFDDTTDYTRRILTALEEKQVTAIVLNRYPEFSRGVTIALFLELEKRYPYGAEIGRFHVRWRT